jgi:hypothetical protein
MLAEEFDRRTLSLCDQPGADRGLKTQVALERLVESVKRRRRCSKPSITAAFELIATEG